MRSIGTIVAVAVVVLAGIAGPMTAPVTGQESVQTDDVVMTVSVDSSGDARWTIEYRTKLDTQNRKDAFDSLQSDIQQNTSTYIESFRPGIENLVSDAENATGRKMSVADLSVTAEVESIPEDYGVVTYSFTWENFASVDGDTIQIGDSVSGLYLNSNTTLVVEAPNGYEIETATPSPSSERDGAVVWKGEMQFATDEPRVTVVSAGTSEGTATDKTPTENTTDSDKDGGMPLVPIGGGLVVALIAGGIAYRRGMIDFGNNKSDRGSGRNSNSDAQNDDSDGVARATTAGGGNDGTDESDEELLSNEEQVLKKLKANGGRMKQKELVEELGWSDAKTSRVVSDLRDSGKVDGFRLGRENVLEISEDDESEDE